MFVTQAINASFLLSTLTLYKRSKCCVESDLISIKRSLLVLSKLSHLYLIDSKWCIQVDFMVIVSG